MEKGYLELKSLNASLLEIKSYFEHIFLLRSSGSVMSN